MTTTQPEQLACFSCGAAAEGDTCPKCGGMTGAIISRYTDRDALEDGILVAITERDRCTRGLFDDVARWLPQDQPPNRWPIDLLTWCSKDSDGTTRALSAFKGLIGQYKLHVDRNDGDPVRLWIERAPATDGWRISALLEKEPDSQNHSEMWLLPNELGGVTAMYPSDY